MKKERRKLELETKVDLVLLIIGVFLLVWIVATHEEFRKGYAVNGEIQTTYSKAVDTVGDLLEADGSIEEKLQFIISQELALNDINLDILSQSTFENSIITTFMYQVEEQGYEGICQISEKGEILYKAVDKINKGEPFTLHEVEFRKESTPSFNVIYGVINTPIIKSININFNDDTLVNILLGSSNNYTYIDEAGGASVVRVDGLDNELNIFYKWDKIYMKPI